MKCTHEVVIVISFIVNNKFCVKSLSDCDKVSLPLDRGSLQRSCPRHSYLCFPSRGTVGLDVTSLISKVPYNDPDLRR